jgi:diadenosine tetraphosphate (Ap4A) HIT family hydrolase
MRAADCPLCDAAGGRLVFQGGRFRLVRAQEAGYPAFYRLVWTDHVREFSDLDAPDRAACMEAVVTVEKVLRAHLQPAKVNLATLGNAVPHLHWHVVARFDWDPAWPAPVWAAQQRAPDAAAIAAVETRRPALEAALALALGARPGNCTAS